MTEASLRRCSTINGGILSHDYRPSIRLQKNALVSGWQVYDAYRNIVPGSGYMRGESRGDVSRIIDMTEREVAINPYSLKRYSGKKYFWIGHVHHHFGHFLLSGTQRLWAIREWQPEDMVFVAAGSDWDAISRREYVRSFMSACGINETNFISVSEPSVFSELIVPDPGFIESGVSFRAWGDFMVSAGDRLLDHENIPETNNSVYLTKHNLRSGVRNLLGEDLLCDILASEGFLISSPEMLSLKEQVKLWRESQNIFSFAGSALHTAALSSQKNIVSLHPSSVAHDSQVLVDAVCDHKNLYLNAEEFMKIAPATEGFDISHEITNVRRLADGVLRARDYIQRKSSWPIRSHGSIHSRISVVPHVDSLGKKLEDISSQRLNILKDGRRVLYTFQFDKLYFVHEVRVFSIYRSDNNINISILLKNRKNSFDVEEGISVEARSDWFSRTDANLQPLRLFFYKPVASDEILIDVDDSDVLDIHDIEIFGSDATPEAPDFF